MKKTILTIVVLVIALSLYCLDVVSTVIYTVESTAALRSVLNTGVQDPLLAPSVEPLVEVLKQENRELAVQQAQSLIDLKVINTPEAIRQLSDRLQSDKAKMSLGINEATLNAWRVLAEKILKEETPELKKQTITALNEEINKSIISLIVPRLPESTVKQYKMIKNFIPALPEYEKLSSNSEEKPT